MSQIYYIINQNELYHHGVKGQKWGVRHDKKRYQKADGRLNIRGKREVNKYYKTKANTIDTTERLATDGVNKFIKKSVAKVRQKNEASRVMSVASTSAKSVKDLMPRYVASMTVGATLASSLKAVPMVTKIAKKRATKRGEDATKAVIKAGIGVVAVSALLAYSKAKRSADKLAKFG